MSVSSGSRIWLRRGGGGGGAVYGRGGTLTINACEARGGYEKQGVRGGGGGSVRFRSDTKSGKGGEGCLPYDDLYLGL